MFDSTIAAISTPQGKGGIGIVRISGPSAIPIVQNIFWIKNGNTTLCAAKLTPLKFRYLYLGNIIDPGTRNIIDEVLVTFMKSPYTYTRDDMVEIQAHGGISNLRIILNLVINGGARLAEPGEFTKRAFLSGRIDLTQAEAVQDIINSKTGVGLKLATGNLRGNLGRKIKAIRERIIEIQSTIEADIEFPDATEEEWQKNNVQTEIHSVRSELEILMKNHQRNFWSVNGIKICICGAPNVGKSTFMNAVLNSNVSIVSEIPGTTRDIIKEEIFINDLNCCILDTAGIRTGGDSIERMGIDRALEAVRKSDITVFIIDPFSDEQPNTEAVWDIIKNKPHIILINKIDLEPKRMGYTTDQNGNTIGKIQISAKTGSGIEKFFDLLATYLSETTNIGEDDFLPNLRQYQALTKCADACDRAIDAYRESVALDLISMEIQEAGNALGEILGQITNEDIFDKIFNTFCVGK